MRKVVTLFIGCCALMAMSWAQAATIEIPRPYGLQLLDGKPAAGNQINARQLTLPAGQHQVVLVFEGSFRDQSETRLIRGEPVVINMDLKADDALSIQFPYPRNYDQAEKFLEKQPLTILNKTTGQPAKVEFFVMPKKEGLQIGRDYQQELTEQGKAFLQITTPATASAVAATPAAATAAAAAAGAATSSNSTAVVDKRAQNLEMLKYWYLQADAQTRKDFQHWIISQQ